MSSNPITLDYRTISAQPPPPPGLFLNRNFMLLWGAYGVSAAGDHIAEMAVLKSLNAMTVTNATALTAMITFMLFVPFFLFGPFNGLLADRLPRRGIMVTADVARALLFLGFATLLAWFTPWGRFGAFIPFLLVGVFAAMFSPARLALLPTLIQPDQLVRANAMTGGLGVIASMLAVALGGYLADHYHPQIAYNVDALTFIGSAILLLLIRAPKGPWTVARAEAASGVSAVATERPRGPKPAARPLDALAEGFRYVGTHRRVAQLIGIAVVVWFCGSAASSTIPALVRDAYHRPEYTQISVFRALLGLGILSGSLILTALGGALRSEIAITWSMLGIGASMGTLALSAMAPFDPSTRYSLGAVSIVLAGLFAAGVMASYNALLQRIVPNRVRGRIFGVADLFAIGALLVATGTLGIPQWQNIDRWIGPILAMIALIAGVTGVVSLLVRLRAGRFRSIVGFWWNVVEFYCKWWCRLKRIGICTVPAEGPVIVIANHTSPPDPLLLIAASPHRVLAFMIAVEFSKVPFGRYLTEMIECIPVNRSGYDAGATKAALRQLKAGKPLGIFIEGRIAKPGQILEPKDGPALLALKTGALVVPAFIWGTRYHESVFLSFFLRHHARVRFGKPIDVRALAAGRDDKETLHEISHFLMQKIRELAPPDHPLHASNRTSETLPSLLSGQTKKPD